MNEEQFQKLLDAAPPLVLFAGSSKKSLLVISIIVFLLMANGIYMAVHPHTPGNVYMGRGIAAFFGFLTLYFLANAFLTRKIFFTLDREGFTLATLRRPVTYRWKDVSEFATGAVATPAAFKAIDVAESINDLRTGRAHVPVSSSNMVGKQVFFNSGATGTAAQWLRSSTGYDSVIPKAVGMTADQFARLMNHWRERAIANNNP